MGRPKDFGADFSARTGLTVEGSAFVGQYKGFRITIQNKIAYDYMGMRNNKMAIYPRLHCQLLAEGKDFPYTVLREKLNMLLYTDQRIMDFLGGKYNDLPPELPQLEHRLPRVHVYSTDQVFAEKLANDAELKRLLSDWYYCDVRIGGNEVYLLLDNEHILRQYMKRLMDCGYWIQAMDICARVAELG